MCGIAGIITKKPQPFDYTAFTVLGMINDTRGGDSCGIFIDGKWEYGVAEDKLFKDYLHKSKLLQNTTTSQVALLHCRKASVGRISKETAQPVVIKDKEGEAEFVVLHNGTIYNYVELAKKYIPDVNIIGLTDSQIMALIFYYKGYDVLDEYNGGAVFAIIDYREKTPKVLLFKGASKKNSLSKEKTVERPLSFTINPRKGELIFSSIGDFLYALRRKQDAWILNENVLCEFDGKDLKVIKQYDRDNCTQEKPQPVYTTSYLNYDEPICQFVFYDVTYNIAIMDNKKLTGRYILSRYGRVLVKKSRCEEFQEIYFFNGVPLRNELCYRSLKVLLKKSQLGIEDFYKKYENLIRYLSYDQLYNIDGVWFKATSPTDFEVYTGMYDPILVGSTYSIISGIKGSYKAGKYNLLSEYNIPKLGITFKELKQLCK